MLTPTPAGAAWPARLAYCAAAIFTLASAGTNLNYGIAKGADAASSAVWAAVSVAVSIVFALSWPALIRAVERRQWTLVPMAAVALVLTGAYSVAAALGSASGARINATATEMVTRDAREKAKAAYDDAKAEMDGLKPSRPVGELEALLAVHTPGRNCRIRVTIGSRTTVCSPPVALATELGRAKRRAELETKMDAAQAELQRIAAPKQANSDAVALSGYLAALGVAASPETTNRPLALLAALVVECGGGLALAVGLSLAQSRVEPPTRTELNHVGLDQRRPNEPRKPEPLKTRAVTGGPAVRAPARGPRREPVQNLRENRSKNHRRDHVADAILNQLRYHRVMDCSERGLAQLIGASRSTVRRALHGLVAAGIISLEASNQGSEFRLLTA